jgi:hypothetical protein
MNEKDYTALAWQEVRKLQRCDNLKRYLLAKLAGLFARIMRVLLWMSE